MSRKAGHDKSAVQDRERKEDQGFALKRAEDDLELVKLRVNQAIRRGAPKDLLEPAVTLIDETIERIRANV